MRVPAFVAATALAGLCLAARCGSAQATPAHSDVLVGAQRDAFVAEPAPSSCRPANHRGAITTDQPSAGHRHYRVTLTAAPGYPPCKLAGIPGKVIFFSGGGAPLGVDARPAQAAAAHPVTFGPGHPVHFDIQVPDTPGGATAGRITFTLPAPGGPIPGEKDASGYLEVDAGTQIGPIQAG